ncbi:hypothetical protein [Dysgonomonas sp. BGC7]|uniref:hypothetical protein n=1 Tax=Dysgonomonas sp. BGC7 TaxID=1658008 RepID=UPI000A6BE808|nr:hypothetical protein [Dysgonomonas sp. BGC7]MBD8388409.1 hypothetical protein [Dysgonomonas sp. BGC7]
MRLFLIKLLIIISVILLFSGCAIINSLLGFDKCSYPGCENQCTNDCNYCTIHCNSYNIAPDLEKKVGKSIDKQLERYKNDQKK